MDQDRSISLSQALIYGAVIIAIVIGGSFAFQQHYVEKNMPALVKQAIDDLTPNPKHMTAVSKDDHILGSADAPTKIVVYTDLECPYCKVFHQSVQDLKNNYIKDGKIAIVYRNMPLDQLHTKARPEAIAAECAAKLGGNDKYWEFVDKIFAATPSNDGLDLNKLPVFAQEIGLNEKDFAACQSDEKIAARIKAQEENAQKAGAQGTPYPIVVAGGEVKGALPGALPAAEIKSMVDELNGASSEKK